MKGSWRRVVRGLAILVLVGIVAIVGFGVRVVYRPHGDPLPKSQVDALLVLGPLDTWRVPRAEELMRQGIARNLVLSTPTPGDDVYCTRHHDWPAYCFPPAPGTTRGEAMGMRRLLAEHGWKTFVVLTIDFHADRARFIFSRCLREPVQVLAQRIPEADSQRPYMVGYQLAGYAKELVLGRCPQ